MERILLALPLVFAEEVPLSVAGVVSSSSKSLRLHSTLLK